jgi:hypothetical protein
MSVINRNNLKAEFQDGNMATESYFTDLIDSSYNRAEDSLLMGPVGMTGKFGLLGPTGGTYMGSYIIVSPPTAYNSAGSTGQMAFRNTGSTGADMFVHNGTQWFKFSGTRIF